MIYAGWRQSSALYFHERCFFKHVPLLMKDSGRKINNKFTAGVIFGLALDKSDGP